MNPTSQYPNTMLNRKRRPSDEENSKYDKDKNYRDHQANYYQNEPGEEDFEVMTGTDNNKKSDLYKERDRFREKERERYRDGRDRPELKEKIKRGEKKDKNDGRISYSRIDETNFNYGNHDIHNSNKNYQIKEDFEKHNYNKRRRYDNFNERERHSQNYPSNGVFSDERERGYQNLNFERNSRNDRHIKREDNRLTKSEIQISTKRRHDEEDASYGNSYSFDRDRDDEYKFRQEERSGKDERHENLKKFNFLIILPKNYFRIIEEDYDYILREIKKSIRDLNLFQYDYKISNLNEFILRIDASRLSSKVISMRIVCGILFQAMKQTYNSMSYLKISILVPSRNFNKNYLYKDVVGFIIGIEGKNINSIRDITETRIDVFQNDINNKYRQIEIQGSPENISRATEKIYKIVNKYYYFDNSNRRRQDENSSRDDEYKMKNYEHEHEKDRKKSKKARIRLGNRNERKKNRSEEGRDTERNIRKEVRSRENSMENINSFYSFKIDPISKHSKEIKQSRRNLKYFPRSKSNSNSKFNTIIENLSKEISPINLNINSNSGKEFPQLISENYPQISNMLNITNENMIENLNQMNVQIGRETKTSINSIESNDNNNFSNISETIFTGEIRKIEEKLAQPENLSEDQKIPLNLIITNQNLNMLKNVKSNIFIQIENKYHCSISKKVDKLSDGEVNILTLYGTPEQNCLAVYYLQQIISGRRETKEILKN